MGRYSWFLFYIELFLQWSEEEFNLISSLLFPGDTVIDIGANIGGFTIPLAKKVPNGVVIAIEPQRVLYQLLNANIALNELINVHTFNTAAGSVLGSIPVPLVNYSTPANFGMIFHVEFYNMNYRWFKFVE